MRDGKACNIFKYRCNKNNNNKIEKEINSNELENRQLNLFCFFLFFFVPNSAALSFLLIILFGLFSLCVSF